MTADPDTAAFYDRDANAYAAWSGRHGTPRGLETFAASLPSGDDVLDLGCGAGWAAIWLRDRGFAVTALDASAALIARVSAAGGIATIQGPFEVLDAEAAFDGVLSQAALQHARREDLLGILARIARALRPGGRLHLSFHEGAADVRDGEGRLYAERSEAELRALLESSGLTVEAVSRGGYRGYDGRPITVLGIDAHA